MLLKINFKKRNKVGISLIEAIISIAILAVMMVVITKGMSAFLVAYRNVKEVRKLENSALSAMDRIIREVRNAESVDTTNSSLSSANGVLVLNTTDSSGSAMTVKFYLSGNKIYVEENGISLGPITATGISITSLTFRLISTPVSQAVKVEMSILDVGASPDLYRSFFDTALLRGSYQ